MIEARITCMCANVTINDIGLRMSKGMVAHVPEADARKSRDLMVVARVGGVTVNFVTRAAEIRQPTAVVGRPKREMPNFVARVSPIQINHDPPTTTLAPTGLTNMHDIVEVSNSIFDGIPLPKTKKKRVEGV